MKRTAKTEYACLALLNLAARPADGPPARVRDIAESHGIPERYLVQILLRLKGAGLVQSVRGAGGGYRLTRSPERINLAEIMQAVDGPVVAERGAEDRLERALQDVWSQAGEAELRVLRETSLARLLRQTQTLEWVI